MVEFLQWSWSGVSRSGLDGDWLAGWLVTLYEVVGQQYCVNCEVVDVLCALFGGQSVLRRLKSRLVITIGEISAKPVQDAWMLGRSRPNPTPYSTHPRSVHEQ